MKTDHFQFRIYVEDTDIYGIVYHANYIKIFERARTEWLRTRGFYLTSMAKDDTNFVIRRATIDYLSPAQLDDMLTVETQAFSMGFCQIRFIQKMFNQFNILLSEFEVEVVCVNAKMAPKRLPKEIVKELRG